MAEARELSDLPYYPHLVTHEGSLESGNDYDVVHFDNAQFDDADMGDVTFTECAFSATTFTGGTYRGAKFNDVWLHNVRVVGSSFAETRWIYAHVRDGAWSGVEAFEASLRRVVFSGCKLDSVNFRSAVFDDVIFDDCTLIDADFSGARLSNVRFPETSLRGARFRQASMNKVDFRGATEFGVVDGFDSFAGAVIDTGQLMELAPALAAHLGITVAASG